jgi:predicted double-glycine peptidase
MAEFTQREKDIYKLGFRNGEAQLQQTINCIKATHSNLMDELLRLDLDKPVLGDPKHITITLKATVFRKMAKALMTRKTTLSQLYHYGRAFQRQIDKHDDNQQVLTKDILKNLLHIEEA